jgi:hypothetical protein
MDVFRHQDIGSDAEALLPTCLFEESLDCVFCLRSAEEGLALGSTEGDEMELLRLLEAS